jgi:hypothetical protein
MEEDYFTHMFSADSCGTFLDFSNSSAEDGISECDHLCGECRAGGAEKQRTDSPPITIASVLQLLLSGCI